MRYLALLLLATAVTACGGRGPTEGPATGGPTRGPEATATLPAAVTFGPPPSASPDDQTSPLVIDAALLAYLPADVGGVPIAESIDEATLALGNADLHAVASAIDAAVAVDTVNGNIVYVLVVRLRPGVLNDAVFRDWRDSYDEGACSPGGAVVGNLETEIDGRTVHVGTCEGGFRTYHVLLADEAILISAWSLGDGRFGELLVSNLRVEG